MITAYFFAFIFINTGGYVSGMHYKVQVELHIGRNVEGDKLTMTIRTSSTNTQAVKARYVHLQSVFWLIKLLRKNWSSDFSSRPGIILLLTQTAEDRVRGR
jgi:hypothetical protein